MKTRLAIAFVAIMAFLSAFVLPSSAATTTHHTATVTKGVTHGRQASAAAIKASGYNICQSGYTTADWDYNSAYKYPVSHRWCIATEELGDALDIFWQSDGRLVAYDRYTLLPIFKGPGGASYLQFNTNGNINELRSDGSVMWSNNAYGNSVSQAAKHYELGSIWIDEDNNSPSGCPFEQYMVENQSFNFTHSPPLWDYAYPWAIRVSTGQDYSGNRAAQHCDQVTSK